MFGIGFEGLILILVVALLVIGPKDLPRVARALGKAMAEFRRASEVVQEGLQEEVEKNTDPAQGDLSPRTAGPIAKQESEAGTAGDRVRSTPPSFQEERIASTGRRGTR